MPSGSCSVSIRLSLEDHLYPTPPEVSAMDIPDQVTTRCAITLTLVGLTEAKCPLCNLSARAVARALTRVNSLPRVDPGLVLI